MTMMCPKIIKDAPFTHWAANCLGNSCVGSGCKLRPELRGSFTAVPLSGFARTTFALSTCARRCSGCILVPAQVCYAFACKICLSFIMKITFLIQIEIFMLHPSQPSMQLLCTTSLDKDMGGPRRGDHDVSKNH